MVCPLYRTFESTLETPGGAPLHGATKPEAVMSISDPLRLALPLQARATLGAEAWGANGQVQALAVYETHGNA